MKVNGRLALSVACLLLSGTVAANASGLNLVTNGDFATGDFSGWTFLTTSQPATDFIGTGPTAGSYAYYAGDNFTGIGQYLNLNKGDTYQVSFLYQSNPPQGFAGVAVSLGGQTLGGHGAFYPAGLPPASFTYQQFSYDTVFDGSVLFQFVDNDSLGQPLFLQIIGGGGEITDISVTEVTPVPSALPLFATGIGALGLLGWRRKRKAQARRVTG